MLKKLVNIILILVLLFTVLPLKKVGKLLSGRQLTEELSAHEETAKKSFSQKDFLYCLMGYKADELSVFLISQLQFAKYAAHLPVHPAGEILVPPPNN